MTEILIVDDERVLRAGLKARLEGEGFDVRLARDGEEALARIDERRPDLVLLDVMMPKMNGFRCCEEIRKADALLPVIFLTAKDTEGDQIRGIGLGGDDYVSKDASDAVLLARIERALSRAQALGGTAARTDGADSRLGDVTVSVKTLVVADAQGGEIARLTKTEADILRLLDSRRGEFFSFEDIISELRGKGYACEDAMVYAHVCNLRHKLGPAADKIVNKRRIGYVLAK